MEQVSPKVQNILRNMDEQYAHALGKCREIFEKKTYDYGTAWRILRTSSITDQIFIKAQRIRTIEETKSQKVEDSIEDEYIGIMNYCVIALLQLELGENEDVMLSNDEAMQLYDTKMISVKSLMDNKNHDYGEAWRDMRISSITDQILTKILRIKQIEDHAGETLISEGVESIYQDMINYALFAVIKMNE